MNKFLMCEPAYFGVNYEINPWMKDKIGDVDFALAYQQWHNLHDSISALAEVELILPIEGLPDMVFTANAGSVAGHFKNVVISTFKHEERQGEAEYFRQWFKDNGYAIESEIFWLETISFEGDGDCLADHHGRRWMGHGFRSHKDAKMPLQINMQVEIMPIELINPEFYHLDTAFCPLKDGYLLYYPGAFSKIGNKKIEKHWAYDKLIPVSEEDAKNFACNAVNIDRTIILNKASPTLRKQLEEIGFEVIEIDMSEFIKSGGSCKCLTLKL